ncbi:MAG: response regulator transcription factor [Bacteroidales bacterium]|nr:response regulator transcription factor [Bacteroidales bacterium]
MNKLNLAIVDDHSLFRSGLKLLLRKSCDDIIDGIFEAGGGEQFLQLLKTQRIDVALMDIDMPDMNGIETTRLALCYDGALKIIALTMFNHDDYYLKMINAGACGFLLKDAEIREVKKAIIKVNDGETYFPGNVLYQIIKADSATEADIVPAELSEREIEILQLVCKGLSNHEIATELFLSKRTVDKHRSNLLFKTDCKNTAQLVVFAMKNKLVTL